MNLQGIVAVSGKPGLWKALTQNKTGFILESLDAQKTKLVANLSTAKLAALDEITIFGYDDDIKLTEVFARIKSAKSIPDAKADSKQLRDFFREIAPDHDEEKVYASDMKKVILWFNILKDMPLFNEEEKPAEAVAETEDTAAAEPEKPAAKPKKAAGAPAAPKTTANKPAPKAAAKPKSTVKARRAE
jgi:chemotaxis protein histidine kinase CheA